MTFWELLGIARRRWRALLVGLVLTTPFACYALLTPPVYAEQVDVVFMNPHGPQDANSFQWGAASLINTAGVVARVVGGSDASSQPVSDQATLPGTGIMHGTSVRLPNIGGQWAYNFEQPLLNVEAVGSGPGEVQSELDQAVGRINDELARLQAEQGVPATALIRTRLSPPNPQVYLAAGSPTRALAAVGILGAGFMVASVVAASRLRPAGRPRRALYHGPSKRHHGSSKRRILSGPPSTPVPVR